MDNKPESADIDFNIVDNDSKLYSYTILITLKRIKHESLINKLKGKVDFTICTNKVMDSIIAEDPNK
jgi:hypothetical protein